MISIRNITNKSCSQMVSIRNITNKSCSDITIRKAELNCHHHQNQWCQRFFKVVLYAWFFIF